jgi:hypothetical protein
MSDSKRSGLRRPSSVKGLSAAGAVGGKAVPLSAPAGESVPGGKPVRISLDVDRQTHRYLKQFALDTETDIMRVLRALIAEMQADDGLAAKVRNRVSPEV